METALRDGRLNALDLLIYTVTGTSGWSLTAHRTGHFGADGRLGELLDVVMDDPIGKKWLREWMQPRALDLTCDLVNGEMDIASAEFRIATSDITPEYIDSWICNAATGVIKRAAVAPVLMRILKRAAETDRAREENKKKHSDQVSRDYQLLVYCRLTCC